MKKLLPLALALSAMSAAPAAFATAITGSFNQAILGVTISGGADLLTAASASFTGVLVGGSKSGDFTSIATATSLPDTTIPFGGSYGGWSGSFGDFTGGTVIVTGTTGSIAAGTETISLYVAGNFNPSGSLSSFSSNTASETISLTQSFTPGHPDQNVSFSSSITLSAPATPPPPTLPEPATLSLLGIGMAATAVARKAKKLA